MQKTIGELVRKQESDWQRGNTEISSYVNFSMSETLDRIDAYHNSKHISGETDSLGREKPFFNISVASTNVWYRATDIDRSWIKIKATKSKDWIDAFLATVHLQEWMRKARFGQFLNEWGRVLAKYGSAVIKFAKKDGELYIQVVPWNTLIVDAVEFENNPTIEILQLTEAQLRQRVITHGYNKDAVEDLISNTQARETTKGEKKDTKDDYIKLYEIHGQLPKSFLTGKDKDATEYIQQMQVISYVGIKNNDKTEFKDFTLYRGEEPKHPYIITHLIKEDGRTLAKGSVELLFESQWMVNHSQKAIKDNLDLASKLIFQTSDKNFVGRNALNNIENGDILITNDNQPLTQLANSSNDTVQVQNFSQVWKSLGNEILGVSESMLGETPKSGTAWRQTEAILQESHSLFELMTENKGLAIEDMMREWIIPHIKTKMDTSKEVSATLEMNDINKIDELFIKKEAIRLTNTALKEKILNGENILQGEQEMLLQGNEQGLKENLTSMGNQRFFKPDKISDKTWKEQFKDLEWELEVDITGEAKNTQNALTTLNTALQTVMNPAFATNKKAQMIVGKILEQAGTMSPIEYNSIQDEPQPQQTPESAGALKV